MTHSDERCQESARVHPGCLDSCAQHPCPDSSCPAFTDANNENLYLYGFDVSHLNQGGGTVVDVAIGNIDWYNGGSIVAACVEYQMPGGSNFQGLYAVTDHDDNLLSWLPKNTNHLCSLYSNGRTNLDIQHTNGSHCDTNFYPLAYNGKVLAMYLGGGGDHVHGGNGVDLLYGGSGNDDLDDQGITTAACASGEVWGEEGSDFVYGGCGQTFLAGGDGVDELADAGGNYDFLFGEAGNDCCIRDSNDNWFVMDGGANGGICDSPWASSCTYSSTCNGFFPGEISCVW